MELRDGPELVEYKDVKYATALCWFWNTERFSDCGRRFRELVIPKQMRNVAFHVLLLRGDLVNLVQDFWLAGALLFCPEDFGHHPIFLNLGEVLGKVFASDRKHVGGTPF